MIKQKITESDSTGIVYDYPRIQTTDVIFCIGLWRIPETRSSTTEHWMVRSEHKTHPANLFRGKKPGYHFVSMLP